MLNFIVFGCSKRSNRDKEVAFCCDPAVLKDWDPAKPELSKITIFNQIGLYTYRAHSWYTHNLQTTNVILNGNSQSLVKMDELETV